MLPTFASYMDFNIYQMDVKSAFLNGYITEKVYVAQLPRFENHEFSNHVFKLFKALYGLKQAPCAWYDRHSKFLNDKDFSCKTIDNTLSQKPKIIICSLYKSMWTIFYLVPLIKICARNLLSVCKVNFR